MPQAPSTATTNPAHAPTKTRRALVVCDQWLGSNGYAGMKALRRAGWDVISVPEWEYVPARWRSVPMRAVGRLIRPFSVREFNRELLLQAQLHRPLFLLVFKGPFVQAATLRAVADLGVRTYCYYPDNSVHAHGPNIPAALRCYDWVFTAKSFGVDDMRTRLGVTRASVLLHGFDIELHRPVALTSEDIDKYGCDVSFIGTWSPKKERVLAGVRERLPTIRLRVWGEQWHNARTPQLLDAIGGHELVGEQYVRAIRASGINISILSEQRLGSSRGDQITSRTFHIPAAGGFMIHERTPEVKALFEEDVHCACFGDVDELAGKIQYFLGHATERERIAEAGRALVWSRDTWDHRVRTIIDKHEQLTA